MVLGAKRGAGRVIVGRAIIGAARVAADATLPGKLSVATQIKTNMRFVFIHYWFLLIQQREGVSSCYEKDWKSNAVVTAAGHVPATHKLRTRGRLISVGTGTLKPDGFSRPVAR